MKVFIVEDSESARRYLQTAMSNIPGVSVIGFAVDEQRAISRIKRLLPDVVTLEPVLKLCSGIAVLEYIRKHHAAIKVIVLTSRVDEYYRDTGRRAKADYVFDKHFQFQQTVSVLWSLAHAARASSEGVTRQPACSMT